MTCRERMVYFFLVSVRLYLDGYVRANNLFKVRQESYVHVVESQLPGRVANFLPFVIVVIVPVRKASVEFCSCGASMQVLSKLPLIYRWIRRSYQVPDVEGGAAVADCIHPEVGISIDFRSSLKWTYSTYWLLSAARTDTAEFANGKGDFGVQ